MSLDYTLMIIGATGGFVLIVMALCWLAYELTDLGDY